MRKNILYKVVFIVDEKNDGILLKDYLRNVKNMSSRTLTKLKNREGGITRDGKLVKANDVLKSGDEIVLLFEDEKSLIPNENIKIDIAYEDDEYIVCKKSGNMPTHPSRRHPDDTLANGVVAYLNKSNDYVNSTIRIINRLDKDTSGLILMAKHQYAASLVIKEPISKKYYAIVCGKISDDGSIELPIKRETEEQKKRIVSDDGEYAATDYKVISSSDDATFLEITLRTGRTHQIRVHFSAIGHPLIGDLLYGTSDDDIKRQALHCKTLEFTNKILNKRIKVDSDFPDDFKSVLKKYNLD
jgi:23S rRNA pseudouridine1911/1915/1917 synthase